MPSAATVSTSRNKTCRWYTQLHDFCKQLLAVVRRITIASPRREYAIYESAIYEYAIYIVA